MSEMLHHEKTPELLIIDDKADMRQVLTMSLELICGRFEVPLMVTEASSADEGLERLVDAPIRPWPNGLIVDGLDGRCWEVTGRARELGLPALLYSASLHLVREAGIKGIVAADKGAGFNEFERALFEAFPFIRPK